MNFLAHAYLSGENPKIILGNFFGDFVKGSQLDDFDADIRTGIQLHRAIDHYTDTHPVVLQSKKRLRPEFGHYSPVIVDLFYDHFLAMDWSTYASQDLKNFTEEFYQLTDQYQDEIPADARHMLTYMKRDNWLYNYRHLEGLHRALSGLARRTAFESKMEKAVIHLKDDYDDFRKEFHAFFPDLELHCHKFLDEIT